MEWFATGLGVAALGVSGYLLLRWKAVAGLLEARFASLEKLLDSVDPTRNERRYKALAAEVDDVLEREARMSERLRKRAKVDAATLPQEDVPNGLAFSAAANGAKRMTTQEVMQRARERGLTR